MSWVFSKTFRCPTCGEGDWHVDKDYVDVLDWGLTCTSPIGCGYDAGPGSYFKLFPEEAEAVLAYLAATPAAHPES